MVLSRQAEPARSRRADKKNHVLIIASQEYQPPGNHLSGIFQRHQARILSDSGFQVGVISIRQALSVPMIVRAGLHKLFGSRPGNALDGHSIPELLATLYRKLFKLHSYVTYDEVDQIPVVRIEGFYFFPPSDTTDHIGWVHAGLVAFNAYVARYGRPAIIHAHNLNPAALLARRISSTTGIPYMVTEHSSFFARHLIPRRLLPRLSRAASAASALAVVSPALGDTIKGQLALTGANMHWVPNVIDPDFLVAPIPNQDRTDDRFIFLSIGNLIPVKNHATLLRAFARAFPNSADTFLRIGGDGPLDNDLKRLAHDLGVTERVSFLGRLGRSQVIREMDMCDAFVLPSIIETFGVVLIEALSRGRPVIATRCGGPTSFIDAEDGLLIHAANEDELCEALISMRSHAKDFDPIFLRQRAIARFGPSSVVQKLETLYAGPSSRGH